MQAHLKGESKKNIDLSSTIEMLTDEMCCQSQELSTIKRELDGAKQQIEALSSQLQSIYDNAIKDFIKSTGYQDKLASYKVAWYFDLIEKFGQKYPSLDQIFLDDDAKNLAKQGERSCTVVVAPETGHTVQDADLVVHGAHLVELVAESVEEEVMVVIVPDGAPVRDV